MPRFPVVFDLESFRQFFREERERLRWSRDRLADRSGVSNTTIQNLETAGDVPGIETVAKLVEAMHDPPEVSALSNFFAAYEKKRIGTSKNTLQASEMSDTPHTAESAASHNRTPGDIHDGASALVLDDTAEADIIAFANLLIRAGTRLRYVAGTRRADGQPKDQIQPDAGEKPGSGTGRPRRGK